MNHVPSERVYKAFVAAKKRAPRDDEGRINIREVKLEIAEKFNISLQELSITIELERGQAITRNEDRKTKAKKLKK
jgi:hypothetical protein